MFVITLIYKDGSNFIVGGFNNMNQVNEWIKEEKTRPYWDNKTQIQIIDNTPKN